MYKLTSVGEVFELTERESGEVIKVGSFDDCYNVIESIVDRSVEIE